MKLPIQKLRPNAVLPRPPTPGAAGRALVGWREAPRARGPPPGGPTTGPPAAPQPPRGAF